MCAAAKFSAVFVVCAFAADVICSAVPRAAPAREAVSAVRGATDSERRAFGGVERRGLAAVAWVLSAPRIGRRARDGLSAGPIHDALRATELSSVHFC